MLFQATLNGTLLLDVWVLKNTAAQLGIESGMDVAAAAEQASRYVGLYRAGQNFAFVPYQVILVGHLRRVPAGLARHRAAATSRRRACTSATRCASR